MQQSQTFASPICRHTSQKLQKSVSTQPHRHSVIEDKQLQTEGKLGTAPAQKVGFRVMKTVSW
jgi:hypothetical protein